MPVTREADGNVLVSTGSTHFRLFPSHGGALLQAYEEGFPPLLNEIPGAAASVAWNVGQDPTQASANGNSRNPVYSRALPGTQRYAYYASEELSQDSVTYSGVVPDFWASIEAPDDAIAPDPYISDHGWRTKYNPGTVPLHWLHSASCPVIFEGRRDRSSGIFMVGHELRTGVPWNNRLREYTPNGIAFRIMLSLGPAAHDAFAGFLIATDVPLKMLATKDDAWMAPGLQLFFNKLGGWDIRWNRDRIASGSLSKLEVQQLLGVGLEIEWRPPTPGAVDHSLFVGGRLVRQIALGDKAKGPHFGLFASTTHGYCTFSERNVFDMGVRYSSTHNVKGFAIVSDQTVTAAKPTKFLRANLPGIFLNTATFKEGLRRCCVWDRDLQCTEVAGIIPLKDVFALWCGNAEGTAGFYATLRELTVDGKEAFDAHALLSPLDPFVMMINPLRLDAETTASTIRAVIEWRTSIP